MSSVNQSYRSRSGPGLLAAHGGDPSLTQQRPVEDRVDRVVSLADDGHELAFAIGVRVPQVKLEAALAGRLTSGRSGEATGTVPLRSTSTTSNWLPRWKKI